MPRKRKRARKGVGGGRKPTDIPSEEQIELLRYVADVSARQGRPPSLKEAADALGKATTSVHSLAARLLRAGLLKWEPGKARTMMVVPERAASYFFLADVRKAISDNGAALTAFSKEVAGLFAAWQSARSAKATSITAG
jgi:repressor LexA